MFKMNIERIKVRKANLEHEIEILDKLLETGDSEASKNKYWDDVVDEYLNPHDSLIERTEQGLTDEEKKCLRENF